MEGGGDRRGGGRWGLWEDGEGRGRIREEGIEEEGE